MAAPVMMAQCHMDKEQWDQFSEGTLQENGTFILTVDIIFILTIDIWPFNAAVVKWYLV